MYTVGTERNRIIFFNLKRKSTVKGVPEEGIGSKRYWKFPILQLSTTVFTLFIIIVGKVKLSLCSCAT